MNNMKRMIWVAVAMLIMIGIMGFGLHTLNKITEVNKERREKDKGEAIVARILETTATTSVWDKLRAKQNAQNEATQAQKENGEGGNAVVQTDENGNAIVQDMGDGNIVLQTEIVPPNDGNQDSPMEAVPDSPQEDFTTVAVPIVE